VDPADFPGTVTPVGFSIPPGDIGCAGDVESGGPPLAAGNMITIETLQCVGLDQGVACRDTSTGNAFRLTTDSYELTNGNTSTGAGS
jgi:hypothetical protein